MTTMKSKKLRQITASIFVLLSLCVSSIAACACAHHLSETGQVETEQSSCHESGNHVETAPQLETAVEDGTSDRINSSCECFLQAAPRVSIKNENLKVAKQAIVQTAIDPERVLVHASLSYVFAGFYSSAIFVSDPYYNLPPGRAPPRL
jgi:hypothetical protein